MSLKKLIKLTTMPDFDTLYLGADKEWEDGERKGKVVWDCDINFQPKVCPTCEWGRVENVEGKGATPEEAIDNALLALHEFRTKKE